MWLILFEEFPFFLAAFPPVWEPICCGVVLLGSSRKREGNQGIEWMFIRSVVLSHAQLALKPGRTLVLEASTNSLDSRTTSTVSPLRQPPFS